MAEGSQRGVGERGSLPLALIVVILVAGLMVVLVARTIATQNQVRFDQGFHGALPVADAGIDHGKFLLNNDAELLCEDDNTSYSATDFPTNCSAVIEGEIDGKPYTFTLTRQGEARWEIDSLGQDPATERERRVVATLRAEPVIDVAFFSDLGFTVVGGNMADSYNSESGDWCTGRGYMATNGVATFEGQAQPEDHCHEPVNQRTIDRLFLYNIDPEDGEGLPPSEGTTSETYPAGDRCNPINHANCRAHSETGHDGREWLEPLMFDEPLNIEGLEDESFLEDAIASEVCDGASAYRTSQGRDGDDTLDEGVLRPADNGIEHDIIFPHGYEGDFHCFETLRFDAHTAIDVEEDGPPVIIVVQKEVIIDGGGSNPQAPGGAKHVGCDESPDGFCVRGAVDGDGNVVPTNASSPDSTRLWIFTLGDITVGNHAHFAGVLWGPKSNCGGGSQADIYGSLICRNAGNLGGWRFHFDDELGGITSGSFAVAEWTEETRD